MSLRWNSKYAIMKDLSLAQGFNVPIDVDEMIGAGDKPPTLDLLEETEEEYFSRYTGGLHDIEGPDLSSIQEMLSLVNEASNEENTSPMLQDTYLSPDILPNNFNGEITPKTATSSETVIKKRKFKRGKNVALESIMQSSAIQKTQNTPSITIPLLLKPDYFIGEDVTEKRNENKTSTQNGAIKKDLTLERVSNKKKPVLELQTKSMFKKKLSPSKSKENSQIKTEKETYPSPKVNKEANTSNGTNELQASNSKNAEDAKKLFHTYINLVNMKKEVVNDVWSRAEREMKALDEMRNRQFTESELEESFPGMNLEEAQRLKLVLLPRHRHYLPDDCLVCEVEYTHQMKQKQMIERNEERDEDINLHDTAECGTIEDLDDTGSKEAKSSVESKQEIVTLSEETDVSQVGINRKNAQDAKELFQKYLSIVNTKKEVVSDVWSRAEREMKAIDDLRKKQLFEEELKQNFPDMGMEEAQRLRLVLLPRHRHYLPDDCLVCEVEYTHQMKQKQIFERNGDRDEDRNLHDTAECGTLEDLDDTVSKEAESSVESENEIETLSETDVSQVAINRKNAQEAKELFQKYLSIVNTKKEVVSDVWSRAKREMKAIDDLSKKQLSEEELKQNFPDMGMEEAQRLRLVLLPCHRHYLPEDCLVCKTEYTHQMKQKQIIEDREDSVEDANLHDSGKCGTPGDLVDLVPDEEIASKTDVLEDVVKGC